MIFSAYGRGAGAGTSFPEMMAQVEIKRKLVIGLVWAAILLGPSFLAAEELSAYGNPFVRVSVGRVQVKAEVVDTPQKRFLGLSHRQELPEGRGMLFIMPALDHQVFCMRGMLFPMDLLWLGPDKVVGLEKKVSPQYVGDLKSPVPVRHVLEVPGGFCYKHGIKVGDRVSW